MLTEDNNTKHESFMGIGSEDFSFIIIKISKEGN
jgi:hypothetical protein